MVVFLQGVVKIMKTPFLVEEKENTLASKIKMVLEK